MSFVSPYLQLAPRWIKGTVRTEGGNLLTGVFQESLLLSTPGQPSLFMLASALCLIISPDRVNVDRPCHKPACHRFYRSPKISPPGHGAHCANAHPSGRLPVLLVCTFQGTVRDFAIGNPLKLSPDFPPLSTVREPFDSHGAPSMFTYIRVYSCQPITGIY